MISSEAGRALACRGPWDVVNLGVGWGLARERGVEALGKEARSVVVGAEIRKSSYRGVVDVVFGGEKPKEKEFGGKGQGKGKGEQALNGKRKAQDEVVEKMEEEKPLSKREMKRRAKKARLERATEPCDDADMPATVTAVAKDNGNSPTVKGKDEG